MGQTGRGRRAPAGRAAAVIVLTLLVGAFFVTPGAGSSATTPAMAATLPTPRDSLSAATLGGAVYLFGGDTGARSDQILRYDPATDTLTTLTVKLPTPRSGTSAVAAGGVAYVFGGWNGATYSDQIVRFDPAGPSVTVLAAKLPSGRTYTSAVWDGSHAYIFGGGVACSPCTTDQIVRFDPAAGTVQIMPSKLPMRRYATSAAWDGTYAYIFGGVTTSTNTEHDDILRYHPATDTITTLTAKLPGARYHTSATFQDGRAFVFGGFPCTTWPHYCDDIVVFEPATGTVGIDATRLPTGRYLAAAASASGASYVFGGYDTVRRDQILRLGPGAGPDPDNLPPILGALSDVGVVTGRTLSRTITAEDPDNDALTIHLAPLPAAATWTDHGDGTATLSWPTTSADNGVHLLTVEARDGHHVVSDTFRVTVDPDPPPTLGAISDRIVLEGTTLQIPLTASDPGNDPLALAVTPLPAGATFVDHGDGTGLFTWSIGYDQAGAWPLEARASDATQTAIEPFLVTVHNVDRAPVITPIADVRAVVGGPLSVPVGAHDPDGTPVLLAATGLPSGATFSDLGGGTGRVDWTPGPVGTHRITVRATSGMLQTDAAFTVTVLPPYAFTFTALGGAFPKASPGDEVQLTGRLTNTGYHTDTIQLRARHTITTEPGWILTAPPPVALAPGESALVSLAVDVPAAGSKSRPRLSAESLGDPTVTRHLTWVIEVPVNLTIQLSDHARLRDGSIATIQGTVHATWWNGQSASAQTVRVEQTLAALRHVSSMRSGPTDASGAFLFDFSLDPAAMLPGDHSVRASVSRGALVYETTMTYTVTA